MNPFFHNLVVDRIKRKVGTKASAEAIARKVHDAEVDLGFAVRHLALVVLGALVAATGLRTLLIPSHFLDGGITGISLLINHATGMRMSVLLVVLNVPFLALGAQVVSRRFARNSIIGIGAFGFFVYILPNFTLTKDPLLIALFGGMSLGMGIGLAIRGGGILDGTEVLAIFVSRKTGSSIGTVMLVFNVCIFAVAAWVMSIDTALYAIVTYAAAAKTVDFVVSGVEEHVGVTIISPMSDAIRRRILHEMKRGCTIYKGQAGFSEHGSLGANIDIIYTVVTRLELARLHREIEREDPGAFVVMTNVRDTKGGMIKRRAVDALHGAHED